MNDHIEIDGKVEIGTTGKSLEDLIKDSSEFQINPIGEFTLFDGNRYIENNRTFQYIGQYYRLKECGNGGTARLYRIYLQLFDEKNK